LIPGWTGSHRGLVSSSQYVLLFLLPIFKHAAVCFAQGMANGIWDWPLFTPAVLADGFITTPYVVFMTDAPLSDPLELQQAYASLLNDHTIAGRGRPRRLGPNERAVGAVRLEGWKVNWHGFSLLDWTANPCAAASIDMRMWTLTVGDLPWPTMDQNSVQECSLIGGESLKNAAGAVTLSAARLSAKFMHQPMRRPGVASQVLWCYLYPLLCCRP